MSASRETSHRQFSCVCIGCGCTDQHACKGGCCWLRVNRSAGVGVCSNCNEHVARWDAGDRQPSNPAEPCGVCYRCGRDSDDLADKLCANCRDVVAMQNVTPREHLDAAFDVASMTIRELLEHARNLAFYDAAWSEQQQNQARELLEEMADRLMRAEAA